MYYKELEKEIKTLYKEYKKSPNNADMAKRYQNLKANGLALMAKYSPDEQVSTYTEDE